MKISRFKSLCLLFPLLLLESCSSNPIKKVEDVINEPGINNVYMDSHYIFYTIGAYNYVGFVEFDEIITEKSFLATCGNYNDFKTLKLKVDDIYDVVAKVGLPLKSLSKGNGDYTFLTRDRYKVALKFKFYSKEMLLLDYISIK